MTRVYKNSTFEILSNQFETIGELKVSNGDVLDDTLTESLDTGFFTSEFTVVKKNPIVRAITLDSYLIRHTKEGERVLLSLYEVMNEDSKKKDVRYEDFVVKFIQDETQEIEMPRQSQPISYYLERSLEGTPIVLGTVETSESKYLEYRKTKRATRLLDIFQDFEVVPHYRTVFKSGSHAPDYVELNIMKRRGMKTDIRLDSKINLLEAEYSSNKGSLITAVEVIPFEKEEKSTVKENTVVQAVEAKPKSTPKATVTTPTSSGGKPAWPTTAGLPITSRYGRRSAPLPGSSSLHGAIDIGGNGRTHPIYATQDAVVHAVGTYNNGGIYVILKHTGDQYYSRYLHLQSYSVSKGQTVKKGQRIATMGTTGPSTGIHLDFAISKNGQFPFNSLSHTINPETYLQTNFPAVALGTRSLSAAARPAGMGHRTAMQLDYLRKQQGGTYTQSSARNNWTPEPASADCSSIVYKSLIAAGIPCGFNRGDWLGTTYTIKRDTENKKYFYRISWASLEPGDIILCNNYGHVVTYMGDGKVFHASKPGTPHGYSDLSYYKPRHNMVCRPNIRGTVTVGKPKTTDTDRPAASTTTKTYSTDNEYRDEIWLWLKRLGATDIHAAATMGNIREEVGATFSPHVDQIGGPGRGLFQWTQGGAYDRWTPVVNWIRSQGGNPRTVEWQIKAYHWELTKTWESDNINNNVVRYGGQKRSTGWDSLNTVTNLNQATDLICVHFERPAVKPQPVRRSHAKQVHNIYKGTYDNIQLPDDEPPKKTASQKTTTTSREVTRMITYDIKHIDHNQDGIISNPRSNLIFDQESQQKYGFNSPGEKIRIQDAYYPKAYYEMRSEDIENEFQKALALLKENSRPKEEYKVTLFEEVKGLNIGDGVTVISHNWDIGRPLIVEADVSEYVWSETDEDNRQIVLANYKRITPEIPAAVRRAQEQINAMSDIEQLNFNISLSSTNGNIFTGMHDETIIESSLTYQGIELKEMVDERLFVWQLFNKDGSVVDTDQPKDIVADMPVVNNSDRTVTIQSGNLVDGSRYRYHLTNPSAIFSFEIYDTTNEIIMDSEVFDASEDVYFTAPENAAYAEITLYNSNGRDIEMWSEPKPLQMFTRDLVVDTDMVNEGTTVTLAVHQQFASINISKADYTQTGSIPPSNSRPGGEFLKEVPGTGFYDGNGNWTGNYEKIMYDGKEWVNQDVKKLEKELEEDFNDLDKSLKARDEKQQAILDGLGVPELAETHQEILDGITAEKERYEQMVADAKSAGTSAGELAGQALSDADKAFKEAEKALSDAGSALDGLSETQGDLSNLVNVVNDPETGLTAKASQSIVDGINQTVTSQGTLINQNANSISSKADQSIVDVINQTVTNQGTLIEQTANEISSKADKTVVDTLSGTVETNSTNISQNATDIQSKADQSSVDTLTGEVQTNATAITQNATDISSVANKTITTADGKTTTWDTLLKQTADGLSSKADNVVVVDGVETTLQSYVEQTAEGLKSDFTSITDENGNVIVNNNSMIQSPDGTYQRWSEMDLSGKVSGYQDVVNTSELFSRTFGTTDEEVGTGIEASVSNVIQSSDIIQASVGKILAGERKGMIGDVILENSSTAVLKPRYYESWYLPQSLVVGNTYYVRVKSTVKPVLYRGMAGVSDVNLGKLHDTADEWELIFEYKNTSGSPTHEFRLANLNSAAGEFQILELYQADPEATGTKLTILSNSASLTTQNLIGDTLAELGIINSDGYFSGDRFMFNSDVKIANDFKLQANHIEGNIMDLIEASFEDKNGNLRLDANSLEVMNKTNKYSSILEYGRMAFINADGQESSRLGIFSTDGGVTYKHTFFQSNNGEIGIVGSDYNGHAIGGFKVDKEGSTRFDGAVIGDIRFKAPGGRDSGSIGPATDDPGHIDIYKVKDINFRHGHGINSRPDYKNLNLSPSSGRTIQLWGNMDANGWQITGQSDMRLKKNIKPTKREGIKWTKRQLAIDFEWDEKMKANEGKPEGEHFSILAQYAGEVATNTNKDSHYQSIKFDELAYMNLLTNQELIDRVEELEARVEALDG